MLSLGQPISGSDSGRSEISAHSRSANVGEASHSNGTEAVAEPPVVQLIRTSEDQMEDLELLQQHLEELEDERQMIRQRVVEGLDNADLNALLRTFDKVGGLFVMSRLTTLSKYITSECYSLPAVPISRTSWTSNPPPPKSSQRINCEVAWKGFTLRY